VALATQTTRSNNGKGSLNGARPAQAAPDRSALKRRRQVPWVVAGVFLVVGCGLAFGVASLRLTKGEEVLVVARAVQPGQPLAATDLRAVTLPPTAGLVPVPATAEATVLGQPAAVALVPGTLLNPAEIGSVPAGTSADDLVALALGAGAYPPALGPGDTVEVVPVPSASSAAAPSASSANAQAPVTAVVEGVLNSPSGSNADAVVSLLVPAQDAAVVATLAAAERAALVELPPGAKG